MSSSGYLDTRAVKRSSSCAHLDLPDCQVEESHAISDLDDGFGSHTSHSCTETTIEFEHSELVEDSGVDIGQDLVRLDLLGVGRVDLVPFPEMNIMASAQKIHIPINVFLDLQLLSFRSVRQVSVEQQKE